MISEMIQDLGYWDLIVGLCLVYVLWLAVLWIIKGIARAISEGWHEGKDSKSLTELTTNWVVNRRDRKNQ